MTADSFEYYGELDELGRCTVAYASIGKDLMPTEKRGSIGSVKPTGWHTVKYDIVDGKYLYNRCHLIGYQLTAENANKNNLITGTRYLNVDGMLLFENMVADYIKETIITFCTGLHRYLLEITCLQMEYLWRLSLLRIMEREFHIMYSAIMSSLV